MYVRGFFFESLSRRDELGGLGDHVPIHVAKRDHVHRRNLDEPQQVALAVPAAANQADALARVGKLFDVPGQPRDGKRRGALLDEVTTIHAHVSCVIRSTLRAL